MKAALMSILGATLSIGAVVHAHARTSKDAASLHGLPPAVRFGATLARTRAALGSACPKMTVRQIQPPFFDHIKDRQMQIDCDGFKFRRKPRHVVFVIADDRLVMIWLMVQPAEESAILDELALDYGPPERPNSKYWIFPGHPVAFRRDRSEILFYAPEIQGELADDFASPKSPTPSIRQWRADIDKIVSEVRLVHPDPFTKIGPTLFLRAAEDLKTEIPSLTEEQRVVRAMRLIASIGDGHTQLEAARSDFALWYSVRKREAHPPWGELYLLTGPKCFSACIIGEAAFLDNTHSSVVGEPAGAALNSFGDSEIGSLDLAETGLHLNVSGLRHLLSSSDDLRAFTPVDAPAPFSFSDYIAGRDPAVDAICVAMKCAVW